MRKTVSLLAVLLLFSAMAFAQTKTVTGRVMDDKGEPVPFATIKEKGTATGVAADQEGIFSITVGANATITISAAGFQSQDMVIGDQTDVSVVLLPASTLQEVV